MKREKTASSSPPAPVDGSLPERQKSAVLTIFELSASMPADEISVRQQNEHELTTVNKRYCTLTEESEAAETQVRFLRA